MSRFNNIICATTLLEVITDRLLYPMEIMNRAKIEDGVSFSSLINDSELSHKYGGINNIISNIHKLMALKLVDVTRKIRSCRGEDYIIKLNKLGSSILQLYS